MIDGGARGARPSVTDGTVPGFIIGAVGAAFCVGFARQPETMFLVMGALGAVSACFAVRARAYLASALATAAGASVGLLLLLFALGTRVVRTSDLAWIGFMLVMLEVPTLGGFVIVAIPGWALLGPRRRPAPRSGRRADGQPTRPAPPARRLPPPPAAEPPIELRIPQTRRPISPWGRQPRRPRGSRRQP